MAESEKKKVDIETLWSYIKPFLTEKARERLSNIKIAYPDRFNNIVIVLYQNIAAGRIDKVDEDLLLSIIEKLYPRKDTKIKFIRK